MQKNHDIWLGNPGPGWDRHKNVAELNPIYSNDTGTCAVIE